MTARDKMEVANILNGAKVKIFDNNNRAFFTETVIKVNECSFVTESGTVFKPSKFYSDGTMTFKAVNNNQYIEM